MDKAWEGQPAFKVTSEKLKLKKIHESLIFEGPHKGRLNLITGQYEPYFITDLCSSDELQRVPVSDNAVSGSSYGKKASREKNPLVAMKINLYIDRFF